MLKIRTVCLTSRLLPAWRPAGVPFGDKSAASSSWLLDHPLLSRVGKLSSDPPFAPSIPTRAQHLLAMRRSAPLLPMPGNTRILGDYLFTGWIWGHFDQMEMILGSKDAVSFEIKYPYFQFLSSSSLRGRISWCNVFIYKLGMASGRPDERNARLSTRSRSAWSCSGADTSATAITTSAFWAAFRARLTPSASIRSSVSRSPAVSAKMTYKSPGCHCKNLHQ